MSYNAQLQENNADLQEILDKVNALPEADAEPVYQDKTVTPIKNGLVVLPDDGYDALGKVFISGDGDLVPENIKAGVEIFGVTGSMEAGIDTSDATATAGDIVSGATAYVNGEKITGTIRKSYGGITAESEPSIGYHNGTQCVKLSYTPDEPSYISPSTGGVYLQAPFEAYGDAETADVAKGKTFTSAAGFKAVGTREESSGGESAETCTVTIGCNAPMMEGTFYYVDASGAFQSTAALGRYTVPKNCLVVCTASGVTASGAERILLAAGLSVFYVTGDCTITFS